MIVDIFVSPNLVLQIIVWLFPYPTTHTNTKYSQLFGENFFSKMCYNQFSIFLYRKITKQMFLRIMLIDCTWMLLWLKKKKKHQNMTFLNTGTLCMKWSLNKYFCIKETKWFSGKKSFYLIGVTFIYINKKMGKCKLYIKLFFNKCYLFKVLGFFWC